MRPHWKGKTVNTGGANLYYETHGTGEPLICLHNFSSNSRARFTPLLPILTDHFECYLVDLRGHGRSDNPSGSWTHEEASRDIIGFCKALGIKKARFLAASSGGMTMLRVARYAPDLVQAMVLDSSTYRVPSEARKFYKKPELLKTSIRKYYESASEIYGPLYWSYLAQTFYDFRLPTCDINVPLSSLKEIQAPTLLFSGDRDSFFTVEIAIDMKETILGSELAVFPNTQHIVMEFYPEEVARMAVEFFGRRS